MKILFVVNNFYASGNGLSASARRTVRYLREAGEDVRVLSGRSHEDEAPQPDYVLADFHVPVFDGLIQSHGYKFAKTDISIIKEAVQWADVVHLEEPFIIQMVTARVAKHLGVPCTATYQFALDEHSLFPTKDPEALAACIDYWLDHPEERHEMGWRYAQSTEEYDIHKSIQALIEMFRTACRRGA